MAETENYWIRTEDHLPPNGIVVETRDSGDNEQQLKRDNNLWFVPDGSMYVYYVPKSWRHVS